MTIIMARRWFNRTDGNTYHSVGVQVDKKFIGRVDYAWGYGDTYLQTAHKILQNAGLFPKTGESLASGMDKDLYEFMMHMRENSEDYFVSVTNVQRKKDL